MHIGLSLEPPQWTPDEGGRLLATARKAEHLGFDYVLMSSHVLASRNGSAIDPLIMLSAVAGATSRIRLATSILVAPYYHPVLLANQAAALDVLSTGRFVLGVGTGWNPDEFAALGIPLNQRGARTDESLHLLKSLWHEDNAPVTYEGRFTSLRQATAGVRPLTPGGPPIWVGGHSDAALRRALRSAEAWHGSAADPAAVTEIRSRLEKFGNDLNRDPATLALTSVCFLIPPGFTANGPLPGQPLGGTNPTTASVLDHLDSLREAGISMCSLWMPLAAPELSDALDYVATELIPHLK